MVVDFRESKETVKETIARINRNDNNWKWKADILKNEIRIWWGYLQECNNEKSHFTIKMSDRYEECGGCNDFMVVYNERGEFMTGEILGDDIFEIGSLNACVEYLLKKLERIAHSRY